MPNEEQLRATDAPAEVEVEASVLIPAFNEAARLPATLDLLVEFVDVEATEILVIDDGSRDRTSEVAREHLARVPNAAVVRLERNRGKGAAVREGVRIARGARLAYMDADLPVELHHLPELFAALDRYDVVIGSRAIPGSEVNGLSTLRVLMARGWNWLTRATTSLPFRDTQCGFKAFRRPAARTLFELGSIDRFAFDVEILSIARELGLTVGELPVTWHARAGSTVRPFSDSVRMALDLRRAKGTRATAPGPTGGGDDAQGRNPESASTGLGREK